MFMMPLTKMKESTSYAIANPTAKLFSFKADTGGKIVVLLPSAASASSEYCKADSTWLPGYGSGQSPYGITTYQSPRNKNDYSNMDYAALAYKWVATTNSSTAGATTGNNPWRLDSPGIANGDITNGTHTKADVKLLYSYERSFEAGESVPVYNTGTVSTSESMSVMGIFVIWDKDPQITIDSVSASVGNGGLSVTANTSSDMSEINDDVTTYVALYSSEQPRKLIGIKKIGYLNGANDVSFEDIDVTGNEIVAIFVLNRKTLKPYVIASKHTLSDVMN